MSPRKSTSRSVLLRDYVTNASTNKITKARSKGKHTRLKRRDGSLNTAILARSNLMAIAKRNSNTSPLLRLPGEIRNQIWKYALGYHQIDIGHYSFKRAWPIGQTLDIRPLYPVRPSPRTFVRPTFALPLVCRQTFVESSALIYTLNTFRFNDSSAFDRWVKSLAISQRRLVASVDVPSDYMHKYRHGLRKSFCAKFQSIERIGVDEHVALYGRRPGDGKCLDAAKKRTEEFIRTKEGAHVKIEWHEGALGSVVHF